MNAWLVHCVKNSVNEKREKYAVEFCFVSFLSFHFIRIFLFLFVQWHFVSFILCQIRPSLRFKFARTLLRSVIFQSISEPLLKHRHTFQNVLRVAVPSFMCFWSFVFVFCFFFKRTIFYKNVQAEIDQHFKNILRTDPG